MVLLTLFLVGNVHATSFAPTPFPDVVTDAKTIVRGTVSKVYSQWAQPNKKSILTLHDLAIKEVYKGQVNSAAITFSIPGGSVGNTTVKIDGSPHFNVGEEVVVMLGDQGGTGFFPLKGLILGKYNIKKDSSGTEWLTGGVLSPPFLDPFQTRKRWSVEDLKDYLKSEGEEQNSAATRPSSSTAPNPNDQAAEQIRSQPAHSELVEAQARTLASGGIDLGIWCWIFGSAGIVIALIGIIRIRRKK